MNLSLLNYIFVAHPNGWSAVTHCTTTILPGTFTEPFFICRSDGDRQTELP